MGRRGPAPASKKELEARGSWRAKKRAENPELVPGTPKCPSWLSKEARDEWDNVIGDLKELGCLAKTHRATIVDFCQAFAELQISTRTLDEVGRVYEDDKGVIRKHPMVAIQHSAMQKVKMLAQELGLSPASLSRVPKSDKPNPKEDDGARKR